MCICNTTRVCHRMQTTLSTQLATDPHSSSNALFVITLVSHVHASRTGILRISTKDTLHNACSVAVLSARMLQAMLCSNGSRKLIFLVLWHWFLFQPATSFESGLAVLAWKLFPFPDFLGRFASWQAALQTGVLALAKANSR